MIKIHKQQKVVQKLCDNCCLKMLCMPVGLSEQELGDLDTVIFQNHHFKKGDYLFRNGEQFLSMYVVRTGFFKTTIASSAGRNQVTGFFMSGEILGLDGIFGAMHTCDAVALEDSEVCELPFNNLEQAGQRFPSVQAHFYKLMSQEIIREQCQMLILGNMRAEERLAVFLMNLSERLNKRGFSPNDFILRMSRASIGSYLGLKLETVSRMLSKFSQKGWIKVDHRHIKILNPEELQSLIEHHQKQKI